MPPTTPPELLRQGVRWFYRRRASPRDRLVQLWNGPLDGDHTLRLNYPLDADSVVADVGGYKGQFASDIYGRFSCHVHVYEPVRAFALQIQQRFARNSKIVTHPYALGASARQERISVDDDRSSHVAGGVHAETVEIRAVVDEFRHLPSLDLVKLNIEGAEYEVLEALDDAAMLGEVRFLQVQFHDFVPDAGDRRAHLLRRLDRTHDAMWSYPFVWESWRLRAERPVVSVAGTGIQDNA